MQILDNSQWKKNPYIDPNPYVQQKTNKPDNLRNIDAIVSHIGTSVKIEINNKSPKITHELPQFLEKILDKKIKGLALNILERLIDFIASFFDAYNSRVADLSIRIATFPKVNKVIDHSKMNSCALLVQNTLRQKAVEENYERAIFVDSFIEEKFKDKFSALERQEIWNKVIDPSSKKPLAMQNLIDDWWDLAFFLESPSDAANFFTQLEKHLAAQDDNREDRWKKIFFVFEEEGEQIRKEYPLYFLYVLSKGSPYFKQLISFNTQWKDKGIDMRNLSSTDFKFILKTVCSIDQSKETKSIEQMNFEEVADLLIKCSEYGFIETVNQCCRRLTELVAQSEVDEDNFIAITEILKGVQVGGNRNFNKAIEIFCSSYLRNLNGEKLQKALTYLADVPIVSLSMPAHTTDKDLELVAHIQSLESLDLTLCTRFSDQGLKDISKLQNLKSLKIQNNSNLTAEGIWVLRDLKLLETLTLDGCPTDGEDLLVYFPEMTSLINVSLTRLPQLKDWVPQLGKIKSLTALNLSGCEGITEESFILLSNEEAKISSLDVSKCVNITEKTISHFKKMPLTDLNLCGCLQLTDESLQHFLEMNQLATLKLPGKSQLTEEGVMAFTENFKKKFSRDLILVWDTAPIH